MVLILCCAIALLFSACSKESHTDDPQMKPIETMLKTDLPVGSTAAHVSSYLETRGYEAEAGSKPGTLVAVIRHIDTEKLVPVTARVTFFFDANGKLNTFEMQRMFNKPIPKEPSPN
jgi:hypothetical protein